jgi:ribosomal protein L20A (L18A)
MQAYRVTGHFVMGWQPKQGFVLEIMATTETEAKDRVLSRLGSRHRVPRRSIHVAKVATIPADQVEDPVIRHRLAQG